jgi:hypothetical protein
MMTHWVVVQAPLRDAPGGKKYLDLPQGAVVRLSGKHEMIDYAGQETIWVEATFEIGTKFWTGWVYSGFLEQLVISPEMVSIPIGTPSPQDAAQYSIWDGVVQYNLCGELCVCFIAEDNIEGILTQWKIKQPSMYRRVFGSGFARGTDISELDEMLAMYGYRTPSIRFADALKDAVIGRPLITPRRVQIMLRTYQAIVGVRIDHTGYLRKSGVLHWVVLASVEPEAVNRGLAKIYNPFTNRMEHYTWDELIASMGPSPYGIWVKRQENL